MSVDVRDSSSKEFLALHWDSTLDAPSVRRLHGLSCVMTPTLLDYV